MRAGPGAGVDRPAPGYPSAMTEKFTKGTKVAWNWGNGTPTGTVVESANDRIEKTINGTTQSRNGTDDNPAYVLEQDDGQKVLKLHSELKKA